MYLLILLPSLVLVSVGGVIALMHEHPDSVVNKHDPYGEINRSYEIELRRVA